MPYDPNIHHRRSIRLPGYDYAQPGAYFVTLCTRGRECVLDDPIVSGIITDVWYALPRWLPTIDLDEFVIMPNHSHLVVWIYPPGAAAETAGPAEDGAGANRAGASPARTGTTPAPSVGATLAVAPNAVAPNAVAPDVAAPTAADPTWVIPEPTSVNLAPTLGDVIGAFKSPVFTVYLDWVQANDPARPARFWQRNYYEHIIRGEPELHAIRRYIRENPLRWALDPDNPQNMPRQPYPAKVEDYLADVKRHEHNP
jgi:REP element-mobilizing transposase RayT